MSVEEKNSEKCDELVKLSAGEYHSRQAVTAASLHLVARLCRKASDSRDWASLQKKRLHTKETTVAELLSTGSCARKVHELYFEEPDRAGKRLLSARHGAVRGTSVRAMMLKLGGWYTFIFLHRSSDT